MCSLQIARRIDRVSSETSGEAITAAALIARATNPSTGLHGPAASAFGTSRALFLGACRSPSANCLTRSLAQASSMIMSTPEPLMLGIPTTMLPRYF